MPAAILPSEEQQPIRELIAKAKDVSPVVKLGIEKLSTLPGASQVQKLSDPLVNAVDHSLVRAYAALPFSLPTLKHAANDQLTTIKQHIPTQWITRVDDILAKARTIDVQQVPATITTTTAEVKQSIQAFYATSVDHFLVLAKAKLNVQLHVTSNNGHANGNGNVNGDDSHVVTREEFVAGLKAKLKHVWDDSLVAPAELFYERAKTFYVDHIGTKVNALTAPAAASDVDGTETPAYLKFLTNLRTQLDSQWEQKVVAGLFPYTQLVRTRFEQPAKEVYASALAHYLKLRENQRVVKATEFIQSYKQQWGSAWNDRLEQPIREVVTAWRESRTQDLEKLYHALDNHNKGFLTLSDFVATGTSAIAAAQSTIGQQWQALLTYSVSTFDSIVPSTSQEQEVKLKGAADAQVPTEAATLTNVATHVTKRLRDHTTNAYSTIRKRAATNVDYVKSTAQSRIVEARQFGADRFELVRQFSSQKLAPIIHIDLVNVAEDLLSKQAKPAYQSVQQRLEAANAQVRASLDQLQSTLADVTAKAKSRIPVDAVQHQWSHVKSATHSVTTSVTTPVQQSLQTATNKLPITELKRKLRDTILNAKALTATSSEYAMHRQLSLIPSDLVSLLLQTKRIFLTPSSSSSPPSSSHSSPVSSPMSACNHPPAVDDSQDIELVIVRIQGVVSAIKELFHWSNEAAAEKENEEQQIKSKMDVDSQ